MPEILKTDRNVRKRYAVQIFWTHNGYNLTLDDLGIHYEQVTVLYLIQWLSGTVQVSRAVTYIPILNVYWLVICLDSYDLLDEGFSIAYQCFMLSISLLQTALVLMKVPTNC